MKRSGAVAAIVCDTAGNTVRQGYCYTCLAMGGGSFSWVTKRLEKDVSNTLVGNSPQTLLPPPI